MAPSHAKSRGKEELGARREVNTARSFRVEKLGPVRKTASCETGRGVRSLIVESSTRIVPQICLLLLLLLLAGGCEATPALGLAEFGGSIP